MNIPIEYIPSPPCPREFEEEYLDFDSDDEPDAYSDSDTEEDLPNTNSTNRDPTKSKYSLEDQMKIAQQLKDGNFTFNSDDFATKDNF